MKRFLLLLACLCVLVSCNRIKKASLESAEKGQDVEVLRYDKLQSEYVITGNYASLQDMTINYPQQTKILIENVLKIGSVNDADINEKIRLYFLSNRVTSRLVKDVTKKYTDLGTLPHDLTTAFNKLKEAKPSVTIPHFYTQISGFNQSIIVGDSILGISLDKYMGTDYAPYGKLFFPEQIAQMDSRRIVPDCLFFWLQSEFPMENESNAPLLDRMLYYGKLNWVVARIMGCKTPDDLFNLSNDEKNNWNSKWKLVSHTLFTHKNLSSHNTTFVQETLFGHPHKSGREDNPLHGTGYRAGIYVVDNFMKKHPQYTISLLLDNTNYQEIFDDSGFKAS